MTTMTTKMITKMTTMTMTTFEAFAFSSMATRPYSLSSSNAAASRASASIILPRSAATNNDDGGGGALALAELAKEVEANASCARKTQTLMDEDRSFVSSLCMKFGDKDNEDFLAAMMDKISRRLDAMPSQLIVALQMAGESLEWKEQDGGGRGGGVGEEERWTFLTKKAMLCNTVKK